MSRPKVYFSKYQTARIKKAMFSALSMENRIDAGQVQSISITRNKNKIDGSYWMQADGLVVDQFGHIDRVWIIVDDEHLKLLTKLIKQGEK